MEWRDRLIAIVLGSLLATLPVVWGLSTSPASRWLHRAKRAFARLANRRRWAVALCGAVALANCVLLLPEPVPTIHDEYSYLLAAQTFASGRITNPTPPMWPHFETYQILYEPTYQSKYPPAQGLTLALGQVIGGRPVIGVWISLALACAALCWMLQAWLRPRWALLGALLAATHWGIVNWWGGTYWGGAVPMLGSALVFGGLRRTLERPRAGSSVLLALGLALLANSRPFVGFIASLAVAFLLARTVLGANRPRWGLSLSRIVLPIVVTLAATGAWMAYYNYRVVGDPLRTPYLVYEAAAITDPNFVWNLSDLVAEARRTDIPDRRALYRPTVTVDERQSIPERLARLQADGKLVRATGLKLFYQFFFYFGLLRGLPLLALPWAVRDRWDRFAVATWLLALIAVLLTCPAFPHYLAPVAALIFFLFIQSLRQLRLWRWRDRPVGRVVVRGSIVIWLAALLALSSVYQRGPWDEFAQHRRRIERQLEGIGDRHLVLVRYAADHNVHKEWIANGPDIDAQPVIWARELGPEADRRLLDYYADRQVWVVEADLPDPRPEPYVATERSPGRAGS